MIYHPPVHPSSHHLPFFTTIHHDPPVLCNIHPLGFLKLRSSAMLRLDHQHHHHGDIDNHNHLHNDHLHGTQTMSHLCDDWLVPPGG